MRARFYSPCQPPANFHFRTHAEEAGGPLQIGEPGTAKPEGMAVNLTDTLKNLYEPQSTQTASAPAAGRTTQQFRPPR